jgi:hypothetical protein
LRLANAKKGSSKPDVGWTTISPPVR